MGNRVKFDEVPFAIGAGYSPKLNNVIADRLALKLDGTVTAGGGGGVAGLTEDSPASLLGIVEFSKGAAPRIKMDAIDLFHLDAFANNHYGTKTATTPALGVTDIYGFNVSIPLNLFGLPPICFIMAINLFCKGRFGGLLDYAATNMAALTGTLRPAAFIPENIPVGTDYLEPLFQSIVKDIATAAFNLTQSVEFAEDCTMVGLLVRQNDVSAVGDARRPDGIVRQLTISDNVNGQIHDGRWGELREEMAKFLGIPLAEIPHGVLFIPTLDRTKPFGFRTYRAQDAMTIRIDNLSPVEDDIVAVAPAAGDQLIITPLIYNYRKI